MVNIITSMPIGWLNGAVGCKAEGMVVVMETRFCERVVNFMPIDPVHYT